MAITPFIMLCDYVSCRLKNMSDRIFLRTFYVEWISRMEWNAEQSMMMAHLVHIKKSSLFYM